MHVTEVRQPDDPLPPVPAAVRRVFIGPVNSAGQAGLWAEALVDHTPDTAALSFRYDLAPGRAQAHLRIDPSRVRSNPDWKARLHDWVIENFTHVLIESNTTLWTDPGGPADVDVDQLRAAGVSVAMVAHGSDVKIPSLYRTLRPDTQYEYMDAELVETYDRITRRNVAMLAEFAAQGVPTFVTSPVLQRFVPSARWVPIVVDVDRWATDRPPFQRRVPVVAHSPSSVQKGSVWIDPAMQALHDEGLIEYRRLQGIAHEDMPDVVRDADIVIEQVCAGGYGVSACEAMAAGRVVVGTVDPLIRRQITATTGWEVPIVRAGRDTIGDVVRELVRDPVRASEIGARGARYVSALHDGRYAADVLRDWIAPGTSPSTTVGRPGVEGPEPACTVIVAVHDTATYLPETLASLERQTIRLDALQIVLVDDGSTDGSEQIVDEFGKKHPDNVVVVHQAASGTPASPFNRGLERATGRYVFFLGSDDVIDDDALEVLVNHADVWDSDVTFGRMEPIGDRAVPIAIYRDGLVRDVDLYGSRLPYNLSNTKLYRRELVERLNLRYREDMRQRCDQPFSLTTMVHARRISMIGDGAVYHARERDDRSNITYTADAAEVYASTEIVMDTIAGLIPPGPRRDHVMRRMFDNTIRGDLRDQHARRDAEDRQFVFDRIEDLSGRYLTDEIVRGMRVTDRVIIDAALHRDSDTLLAMLEVQARPDHTVGLFHADGHDYLTYPGFDPASDRRTAYEIFDERPTKRVAGLFSPARVTVAGSDIRIEGTTQVQGDAAVRGRLVRASVGSSRTVRSNEPPTRGRDIEARLDPASGDYRVTIDAETLSERAFRPSIALQVGDQWYDVPLRFESDPQRLRRRRPWGRALGVARADAAGHLVLDLT